MHLASDRCALTATRAIARVSGAKAAEYYRRYIDVFKDPDPPIAKQVAAVREKLARVTGEPGRR